LRLDHCRGDLAGAEGARWRSAQRGRGTGEEFDQYGGRRSCVLARYGVMQRRCEREGERGCRLRRYGCGVQREAVGVRDAACPIGTG
jgi:hypothetical protein